MNIYRVTQDDNIGYDTYDSFICYAGYEEEAANMLPSEHEEWGRDYSAWCSHPSKATVEFIGSNDEIKEPSIILASFNAG